MLPVLFRVGPFDVESFWVMVFLGFVAAAIVGRAEFRRLGVDPRLIYDLILYAYVGGLVGARLFLLFTAWEVFVEDPFNFLFSGSGWVFYGGLVGGSLAVMLGSWRLGIPLGVVATAAAPAIPLAQAIGRLGCLLAGDGDYGVPTTLPWGMTFPHGVVPTEEPVHPTPIYESMLYTAVFVYLWQRRTLSAPWDGFGRYLVLSGIARFAVEFVRRNPASALGLTVAQWMSLLGVALGAWIAARARPAPASSAPSMAESIAPRNPL